MLPVAAAGDASPRFYKIDPAVDQIVDNAISDLAIRSIAKSYLVDLILSIPDDEDVSARVGSALADATHAEQQAADYRRNLTRKYPDIRLHMPDFQDPDCLVVIGLERTLTFEQRQVLHDVN